MAKKRKKIKACKAMSLMVIFNLLFIILINNSVNRENSGFGTQPCAFWGFTTGPTIAHSIQPHDYSRRIHQIIKKGNLGKWIKTPKNTIATLGGALRSGHWPALMGIWKRMGGYNKGYSNIRKEWFAAFTGIFAQFDSAAVCHLVKISDVGKTLAQLDYSRDRLIRWQVSSMEGAEF